MKGEEETSHQKSFRKGVLMNEKGVGAAGRESLWEAVRRGLAGCTLKLAPLYPSVTNAFIHEWLKVSGTDPGICSWGLRGKAHQQRQLEFWGEAAPPPFLALPSPKWVVPQLLTCETGPNTISLPELPGPIEARSTVPGVRRGNSSHSSETCVNSLP